MPPPPTQPSLLKTLSVTSALSCLIASKRSLIGKFIGKAAYTELNQALLAAYLLHNLSEVERRYGHVKFLKWVVVQFLVSRVPGLVFEGYDWIIFGLRLGWGALEAWSVVTLVTKIAPDRPLPHCPSTTT